MQRRVAAFCLSFTLAVALHVDWHLARPLHHRLSLAWPYHWIPTAGLFAVVGWLIARHWAGERWRAGAMIFGGAILLAQGIEPAAEVLLYQHRLGYPAEPERWRVFFETIAVATPLYLATLWICAPRQHSGSRDQDSPDPLLP